MDLLTYVLLKKKIEANTSTVYSLKGTVESENDLPLNAAVGDAYIVSNETYVKTEDKWVKINDLATDNKTIESNSSKTLGLKGFLNASEGSIAIKGKDGTLQWSDDLKKLKTLIGTLPSSSKSTTIVDYVDEKIKNITLNGVSLIDDNGVIDIPIATETNLGTVKGSDEIGITDNGALEIQQMDVTKLSQNDNSSLILYGGDANTI